MKSVINEKHFQNAQSEREQVVIIFKRKEEVDFSSIIRVDTIAQFLEFIKIKDMYFIHQLNTKQNARV